MIEFDKLLKEVDRVGSFQLMQICLLMVPGFLAAMHMGSNVFIAAEMEYKCVYDGREQLESVSRMKYC